MIRALACSAALLSVASCATVEPEPCTSEWIDWKVNQIVRPFAIEHRGDIRELKEAAGYLEGESRWGAFQIAQATLTLGEMAEDFSEDVVPQVEAAVAQCGTSPRMIEVFTDYLRGEGVSGEILDWVDTLSILVQMDQS